jgi:hypothetical protein
MNENSQSQLVDLIDSINHISLNHNDLLGAALEFAEIYFKDKPTQSKKFDHFWGNGEFIELAVLSVREGVVLAMQAVTLDSNIPFDSIINGCINVDNQKYYVKKISTNPIEHTLINEFFNALRRDVFERIFRGNVTMQEFTQLSNEVLEQRYNLFMQKHV